MQFVDILNLILGLLASVFGIISSINSLKESKKSSDSAVNIHIQRSNTYEVKFQNHDCEKAANTSAGGFTIFFLILSVFFGGKLAPYIRYFLLADILAGLAVQLWIVCGGAIYLPGKKIYQYILFSVTPLFIAAICPAAADVVSAHFMSGGMLLQALRGVTSELITGLSIFAILLLMLLELSSVLISYTHGFIFKALSAFMKMWIVPLIISVMIGFSAVALYIQ